MILTEIQTYLTSLGTLGTIQVGSMGATPNILGVLQEYAGPIPMKGFGVAGIQYERPAFQLTFRGEPLDYIGPRLKCKIAMLALAAIPPGALGGGVSTIYQMISPQQGPHQTAPQDLSKRYYVGVNYYVMKDVS